MLEDFPRGPITDTKNNRRDAQCDRRREGQDPRQECRDADVAQGGVAACAETARCCPQRLMGRKWIGTSRITLPKIAVTIPMHTAKRKSSRRR